MFRRSQAILYRKKLSRNAVNYMFINVSGEVIKPWWWTHDSLQCCIHTTTRLQENSTISDKRLGPQLNQEAQLSPRDRAMRRINWNLANCHATVQKLLIWQVLTKSMVWSWRFSRMQCVIDNVHSTMTRPESLSLSQMCHKQTDHGRLVDITCIPTTCCGKIF